MVEIKLFWQNGTIKQFECNINSNISVKMPSFQYVLFNSSVFYNFETEAENHFLLESLAMCQDSKSELTIYFTVNLAFINYYGNFIDSFTFPILLNMTTYEQILLISLETFELELELLKAPKILKDFAY